MKTQGVKPDISRTVPAQKITDLDNLVERGLLAQRHASLFERTFAMAKCISELKERLTDEMMAPILALQGTFLGFRTDKDKTGGYPVSVVRECLIEAVMSGVRPVGNEFNIIGGRCYLTQEGLGYKLLNIDGLSYCITPGIPKRAGEKGAVVAMTLEWSAQGKADKREIEFAIPVNFGMGTDAIIAKATRKARAWLYTYLTGVELGDAEALEGSTLPLQSPLLFDAEEIAREALMSGSDLNEELPL